MDFLPRIRGAAAQHAAFGSLVNGETLPPVVSQSLAMWLTLSEKAPTTHTMRVLAFVIGTYKQMDEEERAVCGAKGWQWLWDAVELFLDEVGDDAPAPSHLLTPEKLGVHRRARPGQRRRPR
jgi:hypothetical protein